MNAFVKRGLKNEKHKKSIDTRAGAKWGAVNSISVPGSEILEIGEEHFCNSLIFI